MRASDGLFLVAVAAAGCGKSNSGNNTVDAPKTGSDGAQVSLDAPPPPPGFTPLIGRSWTVSAHGTDTYKCIRITTTEDMYISGFHVDAPQGTHHTVLTISQSGADGEYDCSAGNLDFQMLFASGVGTDDLIFPDGVGLHVPAGSKLNLNLHLFDATDNDLTGTTTIYVKQSATAPAQLAEMVFSGTWDISIPKDGQPHPASGGCTLSQDATIFALWPHMHQTATHQLVELTPKGTSTATKILDDNYSFTEQKNYPQSPMITAHKGDQLKTTCTYVNDPNDPDNHSPDPVTFGESSNAEMCFTGVYRYPATGGNLFSCVAGIPHL